MRGSPISNLRGRQEYAASPYESNPRSSNVGHDYPPRGGIYSSSSELEYWRTKARQLEAEVMGLNEELAFQVRDKKAMGDLEEKMEMLIAQNCHFVDENEGLIKIVQQKNS